MGSILQWRVKVKEQLSYDPRTICWRKGRTGLKELVLDMLNMRESTQHRLFYGGAAETPKQIVRSPLVYGFIPRQSDIKEGRTAVRPYQKL